MKTLFVAYFEVVSWTKQYFDILVGFFIFSKYIVVFKYVFIICHKLCNKLFTGGINTEASSSSEEKKTPKKNRCHTCKKKVGLTGIYYVVFHYK